MISKVVVVLEMQLRNEGIICLHVAAAVSNTNSIKKVEEGRNEIQTVDVFVC